MIGPFAASLSTRCSVEVVAPAYRLAPEDPMPAALCDGMKVIDALVSASNNALILCGDSAGGGLAASLCALCVASGTSIAALVLLSPWLDLTLTSQSFTANAASDTLFSYEAASEASELYLQGISANDPLASPLFGNVSGFPPTLINVGSGEVLAGDAERFHLILERANVKSRLVVTAAMEHTAPVRDLQSRGAADSFNTVAQFIDESLARRPSA
jgi:acetyl esterase/lipase